MKKIAFASILSILTMIGLYRPALPDQAHPWQSGNDSTPMETISDIKLPDGFSRRPSAPGSFGSWLRRLPLKPVNTPVHLYDGSLKRNQKAHYRVIDIDIGRTDLQQCADAVIRLRSEYLYHRKNLSRIHFNFTSGDTCAFDRWAAGYRPKVHGNDVRWAKDAVPDSGYKSFRLYLNTVFNYAGSYSLEKELTAVADIDRPQIGDVFIQGGFPGHAVIVVDVADNAETGTTAFLLAQGYMPAQDIHVLKNPADPDSGPWYIIKADDRLYTPEWIFDWGDLRRFREE
jgi:hypothetical protein